MRAGGADVSLRDVIIARIGGGVTECGWRHVEDFGRFWKSQLVETRHQQSGDETHLGGRRLVFACSRRPLWRVSHVLGWGADEKACIERFCLSPYVEEPLNSKVIKKSFVAELRSRYVFFEFRDPYVLRYIYMNIICPFYTWPYRAIVHKVQKIVGDYNDKCGLWLSFDGCFYSHPLEPLL